MVNIMSAAQETKNLGELPAVSEYRIESKITSPGAALRLHQESASGSEKYGVAAIRLEPGRLYMINLRLNTACRERGDMRITPRIDGRSEKAHAAALQAGDCYRDFFVLEKTFLLSTKKRTRGTILEFCYNGKEDIMPNGSITLISVEA